MKRKKWSEREEQTLLSKYSELLNSGALSKLKTREKKYKPIADHVNSVHHLQDPITFPFKWGWLDVSIKVHNMRHQYLGVKQKIRISNNEFNWDDGEIHWENFLKYKEVFGDIELIDGGKDNSNNLSGLMSSRKFGDEGISEILGEKGMIGLDYCTDNEDLEGEDEIDEDEEDEAEVGDLGGSDCGEGGIKKGIKESLPKSDKKYKLGFTAKRLRAAGSKVLELREIIVRREEKRRERDWSKEVNESEIAISRKDRELRRQRQLEEREEEIHRKEMELEERQIGWAKRELEKQMRFERELNEERRRRMKLEEKWEEEEMEWRGRLVEMQIEHEKQMMQMHANACHNQMQILGAVARLVCQFFGSTSDGLGGSMGSLPLQNLQPPEGLGNGGKPDANLPSEFI